MSALTTLVGGLTTVIKDNIDKKTANTVAIILAVSTGGVLILKYGLPYYKEYCRTKIKISRL